MTIDFDDLFGNGAIEPEPSGDQAPPLGLVVCEKAQPKTADGYDELAAEEALYLEQMRRYGRFTPTFTEEDEDGNEIELPHRGDMRP
jgi:hypothetical protein